MRREGKPGPFIPSEVRAQTGSARATTPARVRRCRRATRAVGVRAKRPRSGDDVYARGETPAPARECMRAGDNACARATTSAPVRRRVAHGRGVFHKHPKLQRSCDGVCARATTPGSGRRRPHARGRQHLRRWVTMWEGCFFTNTPNFNARATTSASGRQTLAFGRRRPHAHGRQRVRPSDNVCARATMGVAMGGVFFHKYPKLQCSGDDVCDRATTLAHGRRRLHSRDNVWILLS